MESQLYPHARELFATAQLNWTTGIVRGILLPISYAPDFTDQFLNEVSVGVRVATSAESTGRTAVGGLCSGDAIPFRLLFDTRFVSQAIIYKDTGDEATSPLIAYIGEDDLVSDPFKPVGLDYFIYPNVVEGGFFRL